MTPGTIIHPGIIESITDDKLLVRILSRSACSSCHAKGACSVADIEEKIIEVAKDRSHQWAQGENVMVRMDESMGRKAVIMGYIAPLVMLVVSIIIFLFIFSNEGLAALLSLLMLVPYYLILYLFRDRLKKEFRFRIEQSDG